MLHGWNMAKTDIKHDSLEEQKKGRRCYKRGMWSLGDPVGDRRDLFLELLLVPLCLPGDGEVSVLIMWTGGSVPF